MRISVLVVFGLIALLLTMLVQAQTISDSLAEGESDTYTLNGTSYSLTLSFVGDSTAKFSHGGELSDSLQEGEYYTFSDHLHVHLEDVWTDDFGGGVRHASFELYLARFNPNLLSQVGHSWVGEIVEDGRALWGQPGTFLVNVTPAVISSGNQATIIVENYTPIDFFEVGIASNKINTEFFNVSHDDGLTWKTFDPIYKAGIPTQSFNLTDTVKVTLSTVGIGSQWYSVLVREKGASVWSVGVGPSVERKTIDTNTPTFLSTNPSGNTAFATNSESPEIEISFDFRVNDHSSITNCSLMINGAINSTNSSVLRNLTGKLNLQMSGTSTPMNGTWRISCTDVLGNTADTSNLNITLVPGSFSGMLPVIHLNDTLPVNYAVNITLPVSANFSDYLSGYSTTNSCEFCAASDGVCDTEWVTSEVVTSHSNDFKSGSCFLPFDPADYGEANLNISFRIRDDVNNTGITSQAILVDVISPRIQLWNPKANSAITVNRTVNSSIEISFNFNVADFSSMKNCSLLINNIINKTNYSNAKSYYDIIKLNISTNTSFSSNYSWGVECFDVHGHRNFSGRQFSIIALDGFSGDTTDFSSVDISKIPNLTLENITSGKIKFAENVSLEGVANINQYIKISDNRIEINVTGLPELNKSATLYIYNLTYANPRIIRNGEVCPPDICSVVSYVNGTLAFNVTRFSVFSSEETPSGSSPPSSPASAGSSSGGGSSGGGGGGGGYVLPKNQSKNESSVQSQDVELPQEVPVSNLSETSSISATYTPEVVNEISGNSITGQVVAVDGSNNKPLAFYSLLAIGVIAVFVAVRLRSRKTG